MNENFSFLLDTTVPIWQHLGIKPFTYFLQVCLYFDYEIGREKNRFKRQNLAAVGFFLLNRGLAVFILGFGEKELPKKRAVVDPPLLLLLNEKISTY